MMPGETNLPVPSMTCAPAGIDTFAPTAAILPSRMTMVPLRMVPRDAVIERGVPDGDNARRLRLALQRRDGRGQKRGGQQQGAEQSGTDGSSSHGLPPGWNGVKQGSVGQNSSVPTSGSPDGRRPDRAPARLSTRAASACRCRRNSIVSALEVVASADRLRRDGSSVPAAALRLKVPMAMPVSASSNWMDGGRGRLFDGRERRAAAAARSAPGPPEGRAPVRPRDRRRRSR